MNAGIKIDIKVGSINITRSPYLKIDYSRGSLIDTACFFIADTKNEVKSLLNKDDNVLISFGYLDSDKGKFEGKIHKIKAAGKDTIEVVAVSEGIKLSETIIKESYNDESSLEIIKRLAELAGFGIGRLDIPDVQIPHIVFNNIAVYRAINQIYSTLQTLGQDMINKEYWVSEGAFYAGDFSISGTVPEIKTAVNIISHEFINEGFAYITTPLISTLSHSNDFKLNDTRRGMSGTFRAESVTHIIDKGVARTHIGYKYA